MAFGKGGSAGGFKAGRRWLSWGLAVALVALSFTFVDLSQVHEALFAIPSRYVIIGVIICLADRALMALRWSLLIRGLGGRVTLISVAVASLKSSALSTLVHSIAGDLAKIAYMRRQLDVHAIIIPSLVADRAIGLIAVLPMGACGLMYLNFAARSDFQLDGVLPFIILSTAIVMIIFLSLIARRKKVLCGKLIVSPILKWINAIARIAQMRLWLWAIFLVAVLRQCLGIVLVLVYVTYIDHDTDVLILLSIIALQFVIMRLPISPEGWGVGELTAVSLYGLADVQPEAALVAMLLFRAAYWVACLPGLVLILWDGDGLMGEPRRIAAASS